MGLGGSKAVPHGSLEEETFWSRGSGKSRCVPERGLHLVLAGLKRSLHCHFQGRDCRVQVSLSRTERMLGPQPRTLSLVLRKGRCGPSPLRGQPPGGPEPA